jgi:hypothetical protein
VNPAEVCEDAEELAGMSHLVLADVAVQFARQLSRPQTYLAHNPDPEVSMHRAARSCARSGQSRGAQRKCRALLYFFDTRK